MQVHDKAICESESIGNGTKIWAFAHILPKAIIGTNCNICDGVFIENDVRIGDRVTIKCGVQVWDGITINDDVFVGPNVTFTNDKFPRSKKYPDRFLETIIETGASLGANSTILPGITVGAGAMVGAGAVVTKNVPPGSIVAGNPARITGYVGSQVIAEAYTDSKQNTEKVYLNVGDCYVQRVPSYSDIRGDLVAAESTKELPFNPKRWFMVHNVPGKDVRGEHAHKVCGQYLICVSGSVSCVVDDGINKAEVVLDSPTKGLYISPGVWGIQYKYSQDAILNVFASHTYDNADYIRNYNDFIRFVSSE